MLQHMYIRINTLHGVSVVHKHVHTHIIRECYLYVGMVQGVSFSLYIGIGAKFQNTQKSGERRLRRAECT